MLQTCSRSGPPAGRILTAGLAGALAMTCFLLSGTASAAGSVEAGKAKAVTCAACHGADGNSLNPEWPSLAGQNAKYLAGALKSFRDGDRENVLMAGQASPLSDEDIADLAAFYASQTIKPNTADPDLVATGERLYRGGNRERGISACIACHGPTGRGNAAAGYPALAGQHAKYTAAQLRAYASKERKTDASKNQMMRNVSRLLTEDEIVAVASYVQGLR